MNLLSGESPDEMILKAYHEYKEQVLAAAGRGDADACLQNLWECLLFMNRFRNCDLGIYYDEDLHGAVAQVNPRRYNTGHLLRKKEEFRIAYVISSFIDTGSASIAHRYILENVSRGGNFRQFVLVCNFTNDRSYASTTGYQYLKDNVCLDEMEVLPSNLSWVEKGRYIEEWLYTRKIDFAFVDVDPCSLYALASRPVPVSGILTQDSHTFALGPGFCDFTFLVTRDQFFKYTFSKNIDHRAKLLLLPLHADDYIDATVPLSRAELGVPDDAIVSATTNMWKSAFGDADFLLQGLAELIRKNPSYHHIFAGTPRALDVVDYFLSRNPDVRPNIHYIGIVKNFYRVLKSIDFYVNSYPISGGSSLEAAAVGIPSLEFLSRRNLSLHEPEFLQSVECLATSIDEFVQLGDRLIRDKDYREDLGCYLKSKVRREMNKTRILSERVCGAFVQEFNRKLSDSQSSYETPNVSAAIEYEKLIGLYVKLSEKKWSWQERWDFLDRCTKLFPGNPFAWIKKYELAVQSRSEESFAELNRVIADTPLEMDPRLNIMQALGWRAFGDSQKAAECADKVISLAPQYELSIKICVKIFLEKKDIQRIEDMTVRYGKNLIQDALVLDLDGGAFFYNY